MAGDVYLVSDFNPDMRIRQYMRLDYFLNLLASKKYYVRTKSDFEDERECRLPLKQIFPIYPALKEIDQDTLERDFARMDAKIKLTGKTDTFTLPAGASRLMKTF